MDPKPTLRDVAKAAGVGISTVSYVLNETGLHKVGAETRDRIRAVAAKLNYTPNVIARGLRSGKSYLVGVLVPAIDYSFMPAILAGIDRELSRNQYNMLLCTYSSSEELAMKSQLLRQKQVDGIILKAWSDISEEAINICCKTNTPCVMVATPGHYDIPGVWVDPESMGVLAFRHLYDAGHRNIAVCCMGEAALWLDRVKALLQEYDLPQHIFLSARDPHVCEKIFSLQPAVTAVLSPDECVLQIMHEAHRRNIRIPEDLSVLAMDGIALEEYTIPPLSGIIQPRAEQGEMAARILLQWLNTKEMPQSVILQPRFCERASIRRCE